MYEIRLCRDSEVGLLKTFLKNSWSPNHIFLKSDDILNFQHKANNGYNFVVAYHQETNSFHGVLGIISPNFYIDRIISQNQDIWLGLWKVDKNLAVSKSLGMDMLDYVETKFKPKSISAIGINDTVMMLYKLMGFKIQKMKQWFIPNRNIASYKLITGNLSELSAKDDAPYYKIVECGFEDKTLLKKILLNKNSKQNFQYLVERYLKHPSYKYKIYSFCKPDLDICALIIGREVAANSSKAFRLTELFLKEDTKLNLNSSFAELMLLNEYEYIDFLEYGFNESFLINCGFILCNDDIFVPQLFETFVSDRREVTIAYKSKFPFSSTKGDSDLDRPNQL